MALSSVTSESQTASAATPAPLSPATGWGLFRGGVVVAAVLLLVGALAWFVFGLSADHFVDTDAKRVLERQKILADRNTEDAKLLHDPASWLAKDKGIVRVPIDQAVELTIPDLQKVQPHPAYPLKQSPPQPANAATSPDKGPGATDANTAPASSNPTVGQPSPAPVTAPTPAPATSASNAPAAAPAPPAAPAPSLAPAPSAVPAATPVGAAVPSPDNNANNPGTPPIPGTSVQPAAPPPAAAPTAGPASGAKPEPLTAPPAPPAPVPTIAPTPAAVSTPATEVPTASASPAGTP